MQTVCFVENISRILTWWPTVFFWGTDLQLKLLYLALFSLSLFEFKRRLSSITVGNRLFAVLFLSLYKEWIIKNHKELFKTVSTCKVHLCFRLIEKHRLLWSCSWKREIKLAIGFQRLNFQGDFGFHSLKAWPKLTVSDWVNWLDFESTFKCWLLTLQCFFLCEFPSRNWSISTSGEFGEDFVERYARETRRQLQRILSQIELQTICYKTFFIL